MPSMYLGFPEMGWTNYDDLKTKILWVERVYRDYTQHGLEWTRARYTNHPYASRVVRHIETKGIVPTQLLFNLSRLNERPSRNSPTVPYPFKFATTGEFMRLLSGRPMLTPEQILLINDVERYEHQYDPSCMRQALFAGDDPKPINAQFQKYVCWNRQTIPTSIPLVILSSTFGTTRLFIDKLSPHAKYLNALRHWIKQRLVYRGFLEPVIGRLENQLRLQFDSGGWIGAHLRAGDAWFHDNAQKTALSMAQHLQSLICHPNQLVETHHSCLKRPLNLYLATDLSPEHDAAILSPLIQVVDKLVRLNDLDLSTSHSELVELSRKRLGRHASDLINFDDGFMTNLLSYVEFILGNTLTYRRKVISLRVRPPTSSDASGTLSRTSADDTATSNVMDRAFSRAWIPFIDQILASRGRAVLLTRRSTFSNFVERLHVAFWREHGESGWVLEKL